MSDETRNPSRPAGDPRTAAVIPAAGRGTRLGPGTPKALRPLGGIPMLVHAVRAMARARTVGLVVVVAPPDGVAETRRLLDAHPLPDSESAELLVVPGGDNRQRSVRRGVEALPPDVEIVLVHDAARPLVPVDTVEDVIAAVRDGAPAVVPALPLSDTVKEVEPSAPERVVGTPDRARLRAVQTPQGFDRDVLAAAHRRVTDEGDGATDDAGMVERLGHDVRLVPGHEEAFKVTRPLDLVLAEAVLARRRATDGF
ncbi:2-C-methyl-D-erythritol 4-phosphate cytidylyltransferase [Streptomyces alkaliterrae]|uniref:2-C-methyl-D-erythritol 4-phosphate cytidylyltransferase n=1 Tax=Streptomyces alkaliterrae TaxID=2213162 RepID=A0A5P0YQI0_9ACTN|nr:2-C-methyl-D-erythritol 4-phosphate cytidylyltransferase [Streptomyces alkaliterrae]MBB1254357.1 2-C-methyl-D-erythritol 4-phosphate cytidylyltransferase [Streptomyces alkaliterrae]MBB1259794.1 2-C-methyl-D-erythritol 4-phosphate cytidylyltransferase [Streptomyces alkaliterrae]MQS02561.1 2-C-methyl-D-erythritol 4-phosphate cytidylyltransferase [Streptomyces alkaliterrae]